MQTFLPYADFTKSACVLDSKRLNSQYNEYKAIRKALLQGIGWVHHPATIMWKGYVPALDKYATAVASELKARNIKVSELEYLPWDSSYPKWLGLDAFHMLHQANLVRKDATHYQFNVQPSDLYCWPIQVDDTLTLRFKRVNAKKYEPYRTSYRITDTCLTIV